MPVGVNTQVSRTFHQSQFRETAGSTLSPVLPRPISEKAQAALVAALLASVARSESQGNSVPAEVALRKPSMSPEQAALTVVSSLAQAQILVAQIIGSADPIKTEAGAEQRVAEAVAVATQFRTDTIAAPNEGERPAAPQDVDALRPTPPTGWPSLATSELAQLMMFMSWLLMKFANHERENSAESTIMRRSTTISANEQLIASAVTGLSAAITGAVLTAALGAMAVKKTFESTNMQTKSVERNLSPGMRQGATSSSAERISKSSSLPTMEHRPARNVNGQAQPRQGGEAQEAADLQDDISAATSQRRALVASDNTKSISAAEHASHNHVGVLATVPAAQGTLLNMMAPAFGNLGTTSWEIKRKHEEAAHQLGTSDAQTFGEIAERQQEQRRTTAEMTQAFFQMAQTLLAQRSSTADHIIQKS